MTRLKICGLMREEDVDACCAMGVDVIGVIAQYPKPVPWNVTPQRAQALWQRVTGATQRCLVTGGEAERVIAVCRALRPQIVQLQGEESVQDVASIARALNPLGIQVIKAIPVYADGTVDIPGQNALLQAVQALVLAGADALLLDSRCPQAPHAGGGRVDLALYAQAVRHSRVPVWLAGGLGVQNLAQVLQSTAPYGVDILSGAERAPGEKDLDAIRALCALAHGEK